MRLKLLLPGEVLVDEETSKIIAEAENGSFCLKPKHVDFIAALVPGLLSFIAGDGEEVFLAVDEGILVKCCDEVLVSTRNAVRGTNLANLKDTIKDQYLNLDEAERIAQSTLARLEIGIMKRFSEIHDELR